MKKRMHTEKNPNLEAAKELRERTQRKSLEREFLILAHMNENPNEVHTVFSLSHLRGDHEESLRLLFSVHRLISHGRLVRVPKSPELKLRA